jgi:hypothetical protein
MERMESPAHSLVCDDTKLPCGLLQPERYNGAISGSYCSNPLVKDVYSTVCSELALISSDEQALGKARASLAIVRNRFSPANKLPPELLTKIFMISRDHCVHDSCHGPPGDLEIFSAVSVYWQSIRQPYGRISMCLQTLSQAVSIDVRQRCSSVRAGFISIFTSARPIMAQPSCSIPN